MSCYVIVPDLNFVTAQFCETREGAQGVEIIVEDRNFHASRQENYLCQCRL